MTTTIGSQTNVPDPGSPITSPWAQDTARKLVHTFPSHAARDAWATPPEGALCSTTDDDRLWHRQGSTWVEIPAIGDVDARYVDIGGDTMTGNLVVGGDPATPAAGVKAVIDGRLFSDVTTTNPSFQYNRRGTAAAAAQIYNGFLSNSTLIGSITIAAGGTSIAYNTTSDERLKHVITSDAGRAVGDGPLDVVDAVPVHLLEWNGAPGNPFYGFLAHELQAEVPTAVTGERDAVDADGNPVYQQVALDNLVAVLWGAVQALSARLAALEASS